MSYRYLTWAETTQLVPYNRAPVPVQRCLLMLMVSASYRETPDRSAKAVGYYSTRMGVTDRTVQRILAALESQHRIATPSRVGGRKGVVEWRFLVDEGVTGGSPFHTSNGDREDTPSGDPPVTGGVTGGAETVTGGARNGDRPVTLIRTPVSPSLSPSHTHAHARAREAPPTDGPEREIEVTSMEALAAMRALEARLRMPDDDEEF